MNELMGEKLRRLRKERGWTITELSKKLGVSIGIISEWEHGRKEPRHGTREKLCEIYEISESELFSEALSPVSESIHKRISSTIIRTFKSEKSTGGKKRPLKKLARKGKVVTRSWISMARGMLPSSEVEKSGAKGAAVRTKKYKRRSPKRKEQTQIPSIETQVRGVFQRLKREKKLPGYDEYDGLIPGKVKKTILRELGIFCLLLIAIVVGSYYGSKTLYSAAIIARIAWLYILYILVRLGLWSLFTLKMGKIIVVFFIFAIIFLHLMYINLETAFLSSSLEKAGTGVSTYSSKRYAKVVVIKILGLWQKNDYSAAKSYWLKSEKYTPIKDVSNYQITEAFMQSKVPLVEVTAWVEVTPGDGFPVLSLWRFLVKESSPYDCKIVSLNKVRDIQDILPE